MEVTIEETFTVHPSKPPFQTDHILPLSHLDTDPNIRVTLRYLRVYVTNPHAAAAAPFEIITTALAAALVRYYPFTGTFRRRNSDGRLELHCETGKGLPVVRAMANGFLSSVNYLDDPNRTFVEQLVPEPDEDCSMAHPMILQVSSFECGGFVLGAAIHHALCDGLGATQFFNAVAELARGSDRITVEPVWDRVSLLGPRSPVRVGFPVHEFLTLDERFLPYSESGRRVVPECFVVEEEWLDRFKRLLHEQSVSKFTTFEALGAFIWRAKVKASGIPGNEKVKFAYSTNIRKVVTAPLPVGYWGNGCVPMYVQLLAKDLVDQPVWETANLIKKSKFYTDDEYVRSFIDFQEQNFSRGITAGKNVSGFTDWRHLGNSTVDFGWGGPVTLLPLSRKLLGSVEPCYFLPHSSATQEKKNGFKVLVYLSESAVPEFRDETSKLTGEEHGRTRI